MKKFFEEFKKFITRGNVVDMAVGVIVGSSFTAIVNGLSNFVLKPIINWILSLILGANGLDKVYTFLVRSYVLDANGVATSELDLAKSIYIDWGSFINAIINFFLVAFVLFTIVKIINKVREGGKKLEAEAREGRPSKEDRKEMKKRGIKFSDSDAVAAYYEEKAAKEAAEKAAADEKARLEKEANPSTEELLKQIRDLLKNK
jgi:large conductance mechanosensitive channel